MRRPLIAAILTLATGLPTLALAGAPPKAQLRNFICQQALDPASRATSIKAVMRPVPGTMKLAMRFELLKRVRRAGRAVSLSGPRLKSWIAPKPSNGPAFGSQPGDIWVVKHPVVDLAAPSYYQFRVAFRWFDGAGKVIATSV